MRLYPVLFLLLITISCSQQEFEETRIETHDFLNDFAPLTDDGLVHVVIEIPAGSNEKWEVEKDTGHLVWEMRQDTLRVIPYLPYPANYGMVPQTWLPVEEGGDDDPIDIFLLGPAMQRGKVIPARVVGVIKMADGGEQDHKLIAVDHHSWFSAVHTLENLNTSFPGIIDILTLWLANYKGGNIVEIIGLGDENEALEILNRAIGAYETIDLP